MTSRPRLADVAARAGVSMKTVSNVINDFRHVAPETRAKVQAAIDEIGYRPNLSARNLALGRAGLIALVVPQLDMPYFAALSGQILEAAARHNWVVLIQQTGEDTSVERDALAGHFPQRIDGLILSSPRIRPADLRKRTDRTPLVMLGERNFQGIAQHVSIDNVAASETAVNHLIERGRRRIAIIGTRPTDRQHPRLAGYRRALRAAGLPESDDLIRPIRNNLGEEGELQMAALLAEHRNRPPDAVFCVTDWVALGVIRALQTHGLRVPDDVAVVGFDDIPYGRAATPTLTTISPDRAAIARLSVESLLAQMEAAASGTPYEVSEQPVGYELVVRESTGG
ncbi:LacI family transcriptional regulator [Kribbella amoyensis]|uniref:LacI family transcriptional regulator n=1 Tax=Kribbella amoyensis TaxID=996641 RepID=A0A561BVQ4_9ACTN|nr:LacI family DNA-binding transcriptional regulator [Kribbella amoyensis]TWD82966.1 LacI family transcriptional regulator [Kribbella amoyensis]